MLILLNFIINITYFRLFIKKFVNHRSSPLWYSSYFGFLAILNALSLKTLSQAVLFCQIFKIAISHIMLKTSFIKFIFVNIACISCFFKFLNPLFIFCEYYFLIYFLCYAEANLDNTCWSFERMNHTAQIWMQTEFCVCVVVVAWAQSSCWIYGINLAVPCVRYISFCVVSCYSTIKGLKNDCWNVPSPIYIAFGHCP